MIKMYKGDKVISADSDQMAVLKAAGWSDVAPEVAKTVTAEKSAPQPKAKAKTEEG